MPTTIMASLGICQRGIEYFALHGYAMKRAFKFRAKFKTISIIVALLAARFDFLP
jgi:hypothetical protein